MNNFDSAAATTTTGSSTNPSANWGCSRACSNQPPGAPWKCCRPSPARSSTPATTSTEPSRASAAGATPSAPPSASSPNITPTRPISPPSRPSHSPPAKPTRAPSSTSSAPQDKQQDRSDQRHDRHHHKHWSVRHVIDQYPSQQREEQPTQATRDAGQARRSPDLVVRKQVGDRSIHVGGEEVVGSRSDPDHRQRHRNSGRIGNEEAGAAHQAAAVHQQLSH